MAKAAASRKARKIVSPSCTSSESLISKRSVQIEQRASLHLRGRRLRQIVLLPRVMKPSPPLRADTSTLRDQAGVILDARSGTRVLESRQPRLRGANHSVEA